ncbi:MAG: hypothetical protein IH588_17400 [Anaerolineales bacterium]|nr:hypothetical protein [Anaerolineales bacterium]
MELYPDQVQNIIKFLTAQESLLKRISLRGKEDAEQAGSKVYQLIAAYGRRVREGKKSDKLIETSKPNIRPSFILHGNYFTVHQAAQIFHATSKQVRAWFRTDKLEALELPGLGILIEAGKLKLTAFAQHPAAQRRGHPARYAYSKSRQPDISPRHDGRKVPAIPFCEQSADNLLLVQVGWV